MDWFQRVSLINQLEILKRLDAADTETVANYELQIEALRSNYESEIDNLFPGISRDQVPRTLCREVSDILDMFESLSMSIKRLQPGEFETIPHGYRLKFSGFDGNNDDHHGYAYYLIKQKGLFPELQESQLNSHGTVLPIYRQMLEKHEPLSDKWGRLSLQELVAIAE